MVALATEISAEEARTAPYFIPHVMPERGPLWMDQPRSGLVGMTRDSTRAAVARAVVEGVLFTDRMVLESTIPPGTEPIALTGTSGSDLRLPQFLADSLGRSPDVVVEPDLPAIGAAALCAESLTGHRPPPVSGTQLVLVPKTRPQW